MKKLLFVNACLRKDESRTKRIADAMLNKLADKYSIDEIDLTDSKLTPLNSTEYATRQAGEISPIALEYAQKVAEADLLLFAFPFWDMSFPSIFKVFCEHVSLFNVTFTCDENGVSSGCCKANTAIMVTTRGFDIEDGSPLEQGSSYLKAVGSLWGIDEVITVSCIGMDTVDLETAELRIRSAIEKGLKICDNFLD